jgi:hypothetical protein
MKLRKDLGPILKALVNEREGLHKKKTLWANSLKLSSRQPGHQYPIKSSPYKLQDLFSDILYGRLTIGVKSCSIANTF